MPTRLPVSLSRKITLAICILLLAFFAAISWFAVSTKSPTYDEVYHAPSAWLNLHWADYRIDFENPPLWKYWASLPNGPSALHADFDSRTWKDIPQHIFLEWWWCVRTLFKTPGNDGDAFIQKCRAMMLIIAVAIGALIAWWSWKAAGSVAAIVATALFCLDPNFLAHSPLMKNDVAFAGCTLALMFGIWRAGQALTWWRLILLALLVGLMANVKLTGVVLAAVLLPSLLLIRVLMRENWFALGRERIGFRSKLAVAILAVILSAITAYTMVWADYRFRFAPTTDPAVRLNIAEIVDRAKYGELRVKQESVTPEQVAAAQPTLSVKAVLFANEHHLLPHAWLAGLLFQYATSRIRPTFLLGENGMRGWWYYFPFAMLVKTPVATLLAATGAVFVGWKATKKSALREQQKIWTVLCLIIPMLLYMISAMTSNLNIGLRHVLVVYPFAFILIGFAADYAWQRWGRGARIVIVAGGLMLALESLSVYPNFLSFFNFAAGGSRGGIRLLADSNLDWGQDLKLLARWQQEHPDDLLYLSYFGLSDPAFYGIKYVPVKGGYEYDHDPTLPTTPGVVAVSASNLQGLFPDPTAAPFYHTLQNLRPMQILGGSIYLYRWPPAPGDFVSMGNEQRN